MPVRLNPKYKSDVCEAIHSTAVGMFRAGSIDQAEMARFDESCLAVPNSLEPAKIRAIRKGEQVSQPVFARYLNTSQSTVEKWESGANRPSGTAIKLLMVVQKHGLKMLA